MILAFSFTYLCSNQSEICVGVTYETKHEAENRLSHVECLVVLNKDSLELVFVECLAAKFDEFVTDVCQHCSL